MKKQPLFPRQVSRKSYRVEGTSKEIIDRFEKVTKKSFENGNLTIKFSRSTLDTLAPIGTINIEISDGVTESNSIVTFTITGNAFTKYSIFLLAFTICIWIMLSFIFTTIGISLEISFFGLIMFYLIIRFSRVLNLAKLENYVFYLMKLTRLKFSNA
jgi:hypothetical protein